MGQQAVKSPHALKIGVISTADITEDALLKPSYQSPEAIVHSVASRSLSKAQSYAKKHSIPFALESYADVIAHPEVDAIYIPLPNSLHYEWSRKAIEAGKHVLCEKPMTSNSEEAAELQNLLQGSPVVFFEAFHYRYHPAVTRVKKIISEEIGPLQNIHVIMDIPMLFLPGNMATNIRFDSKLAGGATMDLGCYCISAIRYFGGEVVEVTKAIPVIHNTDPQIDIGMEAEMSLEGGIKGSFMCSFLAKLIPTMSVVVKGESGSVTFNNFIRPDLLHSIDVSVKGKKRSEKCYGEGWSTYQYQLQAFCRAVQKAKAGEEWREEGAVITGVEEGTKIMKVIDRVYEAAGLSPRMKGGIEDKGE